jgi:hypothetical protein
MNSVLPCSRAIAILATCALALFGCARLAALGGSPSPQVDTPLAPTFTEHPAAERIPTSTTSPPTSTLQIAQQLEGRIAFVRIGDGGDQIFVLDLPDGEPVPMADGGWFNQSPAWSPGGNEIAFASDQAGIRGMFDLYAYSFDSGLSTRLTSDPGDWETQPSWSPDGEKITFTLTTFDGS